MTPVFWDMTLYRLANMNKCFEEACCFNLQGIQFFLLGQSKTKAALFRMLVNFYNLQVVTSRQDNFQKAFRFIILSENHRVSLHVSSSFVLA